MIGIPKGPCDDIQPTYVGQIFSSYVDAKDHYFLYASRVGFSIRKATTKVIDGIMILRRFVCHKEGISYCSSSKKVNASNKLRMTRVLRCECDASLRIKRIPNSDTWIVGSINVDHNHALVTLSKRRYLRSNRSILTRSRELFRSLKSSNLALSKQFQIVDESVFLPNRLQ